MQKAYRVIAYVLAAEVVVQAMAIAIALAGLGKWIDDGATLNKKVADSHPSFAGSVGFPVHGINGEMLIPLLVIVLLIISFFTHIVGATRRALILLGMVVLQVILGMALHAVPYVALLHVLNAFGIFVMAYLAATRTRAVAEPESTVAAYEPGRVGSMETEPS
jgi:hypothetical protein